MIPAAAKFSSPGVVTYSPSFTLPVTHSCANQCLYCGFRRAGDGLMGMEEIDHWLERAQRAKCSEVLIISGERVNRVGAIQKRIQDLGWKSFVDYVVAVAEKVLDRGLLPHTNIGILKESDMMLLREVNASMGLMLENADRNFGRKVHPQKDIDQRIATITMAGELKIPFTTGILAGLGESRAARFESLELIGAIQQNYGHIQEIILQNYVLNEQSTLPAYPLEVEDWKDLISFCKEKMPEVKIQIPPNLNPFWLDLIPRGVDDLGGISCEKDFVNPENPWETISFYAGKLQQRGLRLLPRLPIYKDFFQRGWYSARVKEVLDQRVGNGEFQYYSQ